MTIPGSIELTFDEWLQRTFPTLAAASVPGSSLYEELNVPGSNLNQQLMAMYEQRDIAGANPPTPIIYGGTTYNPSEPTEPGIPWTPTQQADLDVIRGWLTDNGLPLTLEGFIRSAIIDGKTIEQIQLEIRETPEFKTAYPEWEMREQQGLERIGLAQIRDYRQAYKEYARSLFGVTVTNSQISNLIGNGVGLEEAVHRLQVFSRMQTHGEAVKREFQERLGINLADQDLFEFFDERIDTTTLDREYERARYIGEAEMMGQVYGEAEVELLRNYGIDPDRAFANLQAFAGQIPRFQKLRAIESYMVDNNIMQEPIGGVFGETSQAWLFRAYQLRDPLAVRHLEGLASRETARFAQQGAVATSGTRAFGQLSPEERRRRGINV